ncbi:MAG: DUF763 domain-containing protein [Conexivisphaerales archaeon]
MHRTGIAVLPLHYGHAPQWLVQRMKSLAEEMVMLMIEDKGQENFLRRISDPYWFQAFGCVLGFDWHSSGLTTVVSGVLKEALSMDRHGLALAGGKGRSGKATPQEIEKICSAAGISSGLQNYMKYASKMCAKVDNSAIQAGYNIYHHTFFITEKGRWAVVQQGLSNSDRTARRYHWLDEKVTNFVEEPHNGMVGDVVRDSALNMVAKESYENRKTCVDIAKDRPENTISSIKKLSGVGFGLDRWVFGMNRVDAFSMPHKLNWEIFKQLYETQPRNYEELLAFKGVGPSTVRALALVAQLIYGKPASWRDPVKFTFAHGGKDGVPFPVDKRVMDETISYLKEVIEGVDSKGKKDALFRLNMLQSNWINS